MQNKKKIAVKIAAVFMAALMIVFAAPLNLMSDFVSELVVMASAETSGDFTYTVSNGNATITKYNGTSANVSIPSTFGSNKVTTIAGNSFTGNNTIVSVIIPATVTIIGGSGSYDDNGAFASCKNLQSVTIIPGSGVDSGINREAFRNCISLQSIEIPGNYAYIGDSAFEGCTKLSSLKYNKSSSDFANQSVNAYAFLGCSMLKTVSLPTNLNSIGYRSFEGTAIKNLVIPEGVKVVGAGAFANCNSLTSVSLPSTITELQNSGSYDDYGAFVNCKNLQTVTFAPNGLTNAIIGRETFKNCISLQSVDIPGNYSSIGDSAFEGCTMLSSLKYNKSKYDYANQAIGHYAFYGCSMLKTVSLPTSLNGIWNHAFNGTAIKKLVIPEGVQTLGTGAFMNCEKLLSVSIPSTVTTISDSGSYDDNGVFANCKSLQTVTIAPSEDYEGEIGRDAFRYCISLQSIEIPGNYTSVGEAAFVGCANLKSLKFAESSKGYSNQHIDSYAFEDCTSLETVSIPKTLDYIGKFAFNRTAIKNLVIPEGVKTIGAGAFMNCSNLLSVSISSTVTSLNDSGSYDDNGVFANCKSLQTVTIAPSEDYEGEIGRDAFVYCTSLKAIEIPANYTSVGEAAFYGCSSLESVIYNDSSSVYANQSVGAKAFYGCTMLKTVHLPKKLSSIGDKCFDNSKTNLTICSISSEAYGKTYADANAIPFKVCSGTHGTPVLTYTLSYNANGGSGAPASQSGATTYSVSSTVPVREGYTFLGWSKDKNALTASYATGSSITLTANTTLYAVWEKIPETTFILYYDANGGYGAPAAQTGATTYTVSSTVPVKEGYKFLGWSKSSSATTASYAAGSSITLTANTTLYAVWEKIPETTFILYYDANGGSGAPSFQYGAKTYTVSSTVPTREGYTFLGWSKDKNALTASYAAGSSITLTANTTLYAVWKKSVATTYFLFYDANGGSGAPAYHYNSTSYTISSVVPVRNGYTFLGWSLYSNAIAPSYVAGDVINLTENTTLYAVWEVTPVTTYVLSYNANGGYGAPAAQTGATTYTVSSAVPVREGYYFLGWSTDRYATTASYAGGSAIALSGNTTLYAVWKANPTYTCKYCGFVFDDVNAYEAHVKTHEEKPVDVTIEGGTIISGDKTPGSIVTIIAEQIDGKIFKRWIVSGATVTDAYSAETTIIIGEGDVVITADYDECTCGCHQTGIAGFFAKIVIFIQKIFGMNVECFCGMKH